MKELIACVVVFLLLMAIIFGAISYELHLNQEAMIKCMDTTNCDWNVYRK